MIRRISPNEFDKHDPSVPRGLGALCVSVFRCCGNSTLVFIERCSDFLRPVHVAKRCVTLFIDVLLHGRRVAVRRQDDAQVDRDLPEEGVSAVSSVSSVRRTNASRRQEQFRVSSSEERQDLRQGGLTMSFVSGDRTRRR